MLSKIIWSFAALVSGLVAFGVALPAGLVVFPMQSELTPDTNPAVRQSLNDITDVCSHYEIIKRGTQIVDWARFENMWFTDSSTDVSDVQCFQQQLLPEYSQNRQSFYAYNTTFTTKISGRLYDVVGDLRNVVGSAEFRGYMASPNTPQTRSLYAYDVLQTNYDEFAVTYLCDASGKQGQTNDAIYILSRDRQGLNARRRALLMTYVSSLGWPMDENSAKIFDTLQCPSNL